MKTASRPMSSVTRKCPFGLAQLGFQPRWFIAASRKRRRTSRTLRKADPAKQDEEPRLVCSTIEKIAISRDNDCRDQHEREFHRHR